VINISEICRAHVLISGRVQGVWFRASTKEKADELKIKGWVKNTPDGKVEAVFEGPKEKVEEIIKWCHHGPVLARVTNIDIKWEKPTKEYTDFRIVY
jgi:acylphosphatase